MQGLWVDVEWLLGLPLEGRALTVLWSAVLHTDGVPSAGRVEDRPIHARLKRALDRQEFYNLRAQCLDGHWCEGLLRLEALLRQKWSEESMARFAGCLGYELVMELHQRLIEEEAPAEDFNQELRALLLWRAHVLLLLLEPLPGAKPQRLPVVCEHIARYGALAWMPKQGSEARERAIELLQRLAMLNAEARSWVEPALQERIAQGSLPSPG
jgi:hypothetical protein